MSYEFIRVERDGHLLEVTIDREQVRNALHPPASREMAAAFDEFERDPELWVAIVTGAGDVAFSAGNDIKYTAEHGMDFSEYPASGFGGLTHRLECDKPIIAAVNGLALGGGFELALACDMIVAADHATFGLTEARVGTAPLGGGLLRLPRLAGLGNAAWMVLTGRRLGAGAMRELRVVQEVVPGPELREAARRLAGEILECAPLSVRACKRVMREGSEKPLTEALGTPYPELLSLVQSEDFVEGATAFAQKRQPQWKGR